jgi:hypothetical protein
MRTPAWKILSIAAMLATPVQAQTYDPNFPVCIQTYGIGGDYISCYYTSMEQCRMSASGRAAQCLTNPYYAPSSAGRKHRAY